MIRLDGVWKWYPTPQGRHIVLRDVHLDLPPNLSIGILGRNGSGKSSLLNLIGGSDFPDRGRVERRCRVSWPLGLTGGFQGALSGRNNVRFVARIHGHWRDAAKRVAFVEEFSELGPYFDMPLSSYSPGMRAKLGFALSMAFEFDVYLVDEVTAVGDADFRRKCRYALERRSRTSSLLMVSHNLRDLTQLCQAGLVISGGTPRLYGTMTEALKAYHALGRGSDAA